MNIGGIELNVGDSIDYTKTTSRSGYGEKSKQYAGVIAHLTDKIITVDLGKYRDTFTINDLACGVIVIPGMKEIEVTTDEINAPYRPLRSELLRDTEFITKEEEELKKSIPSDVGVLQNSVAARKQDGTVDWVIMWPIVKTELEKGRNKNDVAAEFGISKAAMKNQVEKHGGVKKLKTPTNTNLSPSRFDQYRSLSRDELLTMKNYLHAEGELIDIILSCIDKTLAEVQ